MVAFFTSRHGDSSKSRDSRLGRSSETHLTERACEIIDLNLGQFLSHLRPTPDNLIMQIGSYSPTSIVLGSEPCRSPIGTYI